MEKTLTFIDVYKETMHDRLERNHFPGNSEEISAADHNTKPRREGKGTHVTPAQTGDNVPKLQHKHINGIILLSI